jgi:hypothetical protein
VVDKALKVGDHLFYMEELISRPPELGEPYYNADLARVVNIRQRRIGNMVNGANGNSVSFGNNNNVKVG